MTRSEVTQAIEAHGVVAVIRMRDPGRLRAVVDALAAGGLRALEVTMTVPHAIDLIAEISPRLPAGFLFGAGTVVDEQTAARAIDAGAQFIVSPVFRRAVIDACHKRDVAALPGCMTPTEILDAWDSGADIVKVFPATALGPGFIKDVRAPLPQVKLMPTGGVTLDNARDWIKAGAVAVGVGTSLVDAAAIAAGDFGALEAKARRIVANVQAAKNEVAAGEVPPSFDFAQDGPEPVEGPKLANDPARAKADAAGAGTRSE